MFSCSQGAYGLMGQTARQFHHTEKEVLCSVYEQVHWEYLQMAVHPNHGSVGRLPGRWNLYNMNFKKEID